MSSELIFVTGASGFLGSHVVIQLLEKGYHVRAAARGAKVAELKERYARFGDAFETVEIVDIAEDKFPDALKGVNAIIHTAAPLAGTAPPEVILKGAIDGSLNVIRQAEQAGIKRVVVTSSIVSVLNYRHSFTDQDWNPVTKEEAAKATGMAAYSAAKTLAEREVWKFADDHLDMEILTLNPPYMYGPFAEGFTVPSPNYAALSTNLYIYRLLTPSGIFPSSPGHADVRDVAKAHVLALKAPSLTEVGRKRILFASPHGFNFKATVDLIAEKRPQLKDRLTKAKVPDHPYDKTPVDFSRIEEVIGMKKGDFADFENTILDTVDSLLKLERDWVAKGYTVELPSA